MTKPLHELTIHEAPAGMRRGDFSAVELTKALLGRIAAGDGRVQAYLTVTGVRAVVQAVAADPHGLGYAALSYVRHAGDSVRVLGLVVSPGEPAVDPRDEAAAREGRYPITRALSLVTLAEPRPDAAALVRQAAKRSTLPAAPERQPVDRSC